MIQSPSEQEAAARADEQNSIATLDLTADTLAPGSVLGKRYRIHSLLGRGGMGEVWRAFDLKLRVEVALKALHTRMLSSERALETLHQEVRVAREVISPNVCRVFELLELTGQELVTMEYVDGNTLLEILAARGPLALEEAHDVASQLLAGLEAIHRADLVHRDLKPENVMITRTGRVVVMDLGIAKGLADSSATVAGTPAYMSPEQLRGEALDARADVFSVGVVLAEMVAPGGIGERSSREKIWSDLRLEPPRPPEGPWSAVLARAVAPEREHRHASAAMLARALEEVTLVATDSDFVQPYPGLASFQETDAEFFYGRELEVEAMWKKLRRSHLLALIGPSGAGKSSFLRAGLLPATPSGWKVVITAPGDRPVKALAAALSMELEDETGLFGELLQLDEHEMALALASRWRQRHDQALLIVDQFEELFSQNDPEMQSGFAGLLSRLTLEADVRVLLSMRDDFFFHCHEHESLRPILSELTLLGPPTGSALRRAVVQPALKCGYRFEDEGLVEELLAEVEHERGALPMLAFAAARLWERRDREHGLLTRKAYGEIGGAGGALAQHAEHTIERIGHHRIALARELFRNLVTAQGTRAARNRDELLSVFEGEGAATAAAEVLDALVEARLLTSYEQPAEEGERDVHRRVEIVHESLLTNWPRLVRWQTQDTEGAQLRDELRQAARMWEQHGRSEDLLWTGTAFREFQLWRERYPGGLTEQESAFGAAMTRHAERRKRRRRMAVATAFGALLTVLAIVGDFWRRSVAETRRAEASKLLALAQLRLESDPTEALAFTMASLELADAEESRLFMMTTLASGPPVKVLDPERGHNLMVPSFSRDGRWLSLAGVAREEVLVWHQDGTGPVVLGGHLASPTGPSFADWTSENELVTGHWNEDRTRIWSFPGGDLVREIDLGGPAYWLVGETHLLAEVMATDVETGNEIYRLRSWKLPEGEAQELGTVDRTELGDNLSMFDFDGSGWIYGDGRRVLHRPLPLKEGVPGRLVGSHETHAWYGGYPTEPNRLWTRDRTTGELRLWDLTASDTQPLRIVAPPAGLEAGTRFRHGLDGRWLLDNMDLRDGKALLWDPSALPGADPRELKRSGSWYYSRLDFHPDGDWVVATTRGLSELSFWPLATTAPIVVKGYDTTTFRPVVFTADGRYLATYWDQDKLRLWPLAASGSREIRELEIESGISSLGLAFDPVGDQLLVSGEGNRLFVVPVDGGPPRRLGGFSAETLVIRGVFSPSGRLAAAATAYSSEEHELRVWDLENGETRVFELPQPATASAGENDSSGDTSGAWVAFLAFVDESTLFTAGDSGVLRWDLETGTFRRFRAVEPGQHARLWLSGDRRRLITWVGEAAIGCRPPELHDLQAGESRELEIFASCKDLDWETQLAFDDTLDALAMGRRDGSLWVGRVGGAPHLLAGHQGPVEGLAFSPDGRWIASSGEDKTLRLWPMPDLDQPPLHTLPRDELLARLETLTNLRAVRDPESSTGWTIEIGPFPGWEKVPTW